MPAVPKSLQGGIWNKQNDSDSDLAELSDRETLIWHIWVAAIDSIYENFFPLQF